MQYVPSKKGSRAWRLLRVIDFDSENPSVIGVSLFRLMVR